MKIITYVTEHKEHVIGFAIYAILFAALTVGAGLIRAGDPLGFFKAVLSQPLGSPASPNLTSGQGYWYCWDSGSPDPHHLGHPVTGDHLCTTQELGR